MRFSCFLSFFFAGSHGIDAVSLIANISTSVMLQTLVLRGPTLKTLQGVVLNTACADTPRTRSSCWVRQCGQALSRKGCGLESVQDAVTQLSPHVTHVPVSLSPVLPQPNKLKEKQKTRVPTLNLPVPVPASPPPTSRPRSPMSLPQSRVAMFARALHRVKAPPARKDLVSCMARKCGSVVRKCLVSCRRSGLYNLCWLGSV